MSSLYNIDLCHVSLLNRYNLVHESKEIYPLWKAYSDRRSRRVAIETSAKEMGLYTRNS